MNWPPAAVAPYDPGLANAKMDKFNFNDKKVTLKRPANISVSELRRRRRERTPILHIEQLVADGVYLYILTNKELLFNRVRSHLELGTAHRFLAGESGTDAVFIAGELKKTGNNIEFNLMSGTYTLEILRGFITDEEKAKVEARMLRHIQTLLEKNGFTAHFTKETFITEAAMPISRDELRNYADMGYNVRAHNRAGFCDPVALRKLEQQITLRERTLTKLKIDMESDTTLLELKARLNAARDCLSKATRFSGGRRTHKR